jgi:uncharacterized protein
MFTKVFIGIIRFYQFFSQRFWPHACRFYPGCSEYMILAIKKYGLFLGIAKGVGRVFRCHPGHPGGVDMP